MLISRASLAAALFAVPALHAQLQIPAGTPLPVSIPAHLPLRAGQPIHAQLLYPLYVDNQLVLPAKTIVNGSVVSLVPDRARRIRARFGGDFTPLRNPVVAFTSITLASGAAVPITTGSASDGAPVYRLTLPSPRTGGLVSHAFAALKQIAKDRIAIITGPDKGDRFVQFLYSQLPYHPQRIAKNTAWTVETTSPTPFDAPLPAPEAPAATATAPPSTPPTPDAPPTWTLQAYLDAPISSATSKAGQPIRAVVAEPIRAPDGAIAVPEGSVLTGTVTQARPARRFSRAGVLRFSFNQIAFPGQQPHAVRASLTGVESSSDVSLAMDSEGQVKPKSQDKVVVPLLLVLLAAAPLHHDRDGENHTFGKDAVASNSLGLLGFIVGTAAQKPNVASGIGYYGAALSIYQRILSRGKEVAFPRDSRMIIQTTATRATPMATPRPRP